MMPRLSGIIAPILLIVLISSCGGGSSQPQSIAFSAPGPINKVVGDASFTNIAAGGGGSGAITYASDMPSVATVDPQSGNVTIVGAGAATITATKAADSQYMAAQASYTARIAPQSVTITAWLGPDDTQASFSPLPFPLDFTRSTDPTCDPVNFAVCTNGMETPTGSAPIVDTVANLKSTAAYWLVHGSRATQTIVAPEQTFSDYINPAAVVLNGRLWVVGNGANVWSSADGLNWRLETNSAPFGSRKGFKVIAFNNALWLIGGSTGASNTRGVIFNDVWTSSDGTTWTRVTAAANFGVRGDFGLASFGGHLWISGGYDGNSILDDVWSSADGVNWTLATVSAIPGGRSNHAMLAFKNQLWIIAGADNSGTAHSDVWSSPDGVNWTLVTSSGGFTPNTDYQVVTDGTMLWLISGAINPVFPSSGRDVWSSSDGKTWTEVTPAADFPPLAREGVAYWNGALWVVGGGSHVWTSPTGQHWAEKTVTARFPGPVAVSIVAYQGRLWATGSNALWSSADGIAWTAETSALPNGELLQLLALPDRLLLIAQGVTANSSSAPDPNDEVWQSLDGNAWTKAGSVPINSYDTPIFVAANGRVWAFGQNVSASLPQQEVWSTSDGANWTQVSANPPFSNLTGYVVIPFKGQLWVLGARTSSGLADTSWSSPDGSTWQSTPTGLPTSFGISLGLAVGDAMCVYGNNTDPVRPAWCSNDGLTWSFRSSNAPYGPLTPFNGNYIGVGFQVIGVTTFTDSDLVWQSADGLVWRQGYRNTMQF